MLGIQIDVNLFLKQTPEDGLSKPLPARDCYW